MKSLSRGHVLVAAALAVVFGAGAAPLPRDPNWWRS